MSVDHLIGMYEDDDQGDIQPAGVGLGATQAHAGSRCAQGGARQEHHTIDACMADASEHASIV